METQIQKTENNLPAEQQSVSPEIINQLVLKGDLSGLSVSQKLEYYKQYCHRLGLDPMTQPFKLLNISGREILYCDRSGIQQLSQLHKVSHAITSRELTGGCYIVSAKAFLPDGRFTESIGAVSLQKQDGTWETNTSGKKYFKLNGKSIDIIGDELCNAMMKAETKAKRRATLDLLGLGMTDESEIETIPNGKIIEIKPETKPEITEADLVKSAELLKNFCESIKFHESAAELKKKCPLIIIEAQKEEMLPIHIDVLKKQINEQYKKLKTQNETGIPSK